MRILVDVLQAALAALLENPPLLLQRIMLPLIVLLVGTLLSGLLPATATLGAALNFVGYVLLAVAVHRYILVGDPALADENLGKAAFLYFVWLIATGVVAALIAVPIMLMLASVISGFGVFFALLPALYVTSRLSLVLPDRAIGRETEWREIWAVSVGNGWKLTAILVLLPMLFSLPFSLLQAVLPAGFSVLIEVLAVAPLVILNVALLSIAYQQLRELPAA